MAGTKRHSSWFLNEWLAVEQGKIADSEALWFPSTSNPLVDPKEWERTRQYLQNRGRMDIWENEYICDPHFQAGLSSEIKYPEFDRRLHICAPFAFPSDYRHFIGMDWGMEHPTAAVWGAVSQDGKVFIYDEYKIAGKNVYSVAKTIREQSGEQKIEITVLDWSCWRSESDGRSIANRIMEAGLKPLIQGRREDKAFYGANTVKAYLRPISGAPKLQIFPNCKWLIEELENLKWKDGKNDDMCDALRYLLVFLSSLTWNVKIKQENFDVQPYQINLLDHFKEKNNGFWNEENGYLI